MPFLRSFHELVRLYPRARVHVELREPRRERLPLQILLKRADICAAVLAKRAFLFEVQHELPVLKNQLHACFLLVY